MMITCVEAGNVVSSTADVEALVEIGSLINQQHMNRSRLGVTNQFCSGNQWFDASNQSSGGAHRCVIQCLDIGHQRL
jgi:hypothetical protein